jgi:hypothetical protein
MKVRTPLFIPFLSFAGCLLMASGCFTASVVKDPGTLPPAVQAYEHLDFYRGGSDFKDTGICVRQGRIYTILPSVSYLRGWTKATIGSESVFFRRYHNKAGSSGTPSLGYSLNYLGSTSSSVSALRS